jgi:hypothetical protein
VLLAVALAAPAAARSQAPADRIPVDRPIRYWVAPAAGDSGAREGDRTLARWALEAWARQLDRGPELIEAPADSADVRIHWVSAADGLFGETRTRRVRGREVADVFVEPDTDVLGADIARQARQDPLFRDAIVYLTCVHELGHAFGLGHTSAFADIMYSFEYGGDFVGYFMRFRGQLRSRADLPRVSPFSPADRAALRSIASTTR